MFEFEITQQSKKSKARTGVFKTPHGDICTPVFMPVGTVGAVKTMTPDDLETVGAQIILANTYHLYLRPGNKLIKKAGGLHNYTGYPRPFLTDSGGYQVFSLGKAMVEKRGGDIKPTKISDKGVEFFSHIDGSKHFFSPEDSIKIQQDLGADIIMAFDECPPATADRAEVRKAVTRTHAWLERCIKVKSNSNQALIPICQGGLHKDLREESSKFINSKNMPANAIGGVSVGEAKKDIYKVVDWCIKYLDEKKPRYLMGVGYPEDIVEVISRGIDMFDCVLPTRLARHGLVWLFSDDGRQINLKKLNKSYSQINLKNAKYKTDFDPISKTCRCYACKNRLSKSYLKHLISENEPLGIHLLTIHNLTFIFDLIEEMKTAIASNRY